MAKVYTVTLGGKEYPLAYTPRDAIALKRRFGKPLTLLIRQDVMGMQERPKTEADCKAGEKLKPGETVWELQAYYDLEVQIAFLHLGILSGGAPKNVTEEQVTNWVTEHLKARQNMGPLIEPVWRCAFLSGITGASIDTEAEEPAGKE